jgi:hypothetical protein
MFIKITDFFDLEYYSVSKGRPSTKQSHLSLFVPIGRILAETIYLDRTRSFSFIVICVGV